MAIRQVTRRAFLHLGAAAGFIAALTGCPPRTRGKGIIAYKRSGRGLHVSNAAKKHNANRIYRTFMAASADAPHPGDNSKVVMITINRNLHRQLFPGMKAVADLRFDL